MPKSVFSVVFYGVIDADHIRIDWRDEISPPNPDLEAMVADAWEKACHDARRKQAVLFNGKLVRYLRHRVDHHVLVIEAGPTDYAHFMGTNFLNAARGGEFGWNTYSNPIGTSATIITSDGWLLLGRRNQRVACLPGYVHTFGGGLEPEDKSSDGTLDAFASIARELEEELALKHTDIQELICLGIVRDATHQPELIFDAQVPYTRTDIENRIQVGLPDEEHESIVACRDDPTAAAEFFRSTDRLAPIAAGAIALHIRRRFGEECYQALIEIP